MTYEILTRNQSTQVLAEIVDGTQIERGVIINGVKGWQAYRTQPGAGGRNDPVGVPVCVSRMVNQHEGGAQIAAALGLGEKRRPEPSPYLVDIGRSLTLPTCGEPLAAHNPRQSLKPSSPNAQQIQEQAILARLPTDAVDRYIVTNMDCSQERFAAFGKATRRSWRKRARQEMMAR